VTTLPAPALADIATPTPNPATRPGPRSPGESPAASVPTAAEKRAQNPLFVPTWCIQGLLPRLPLVFPVEADLPPSPKSRYCSRYRYLGPELLLDPNELANLSDFQVALYLIDFSPLERVLAQKYVPSLKGQVPFHPVSMFLAVCLRLEDRRPWRKLARLLAGKDGPHWRQLFGFSDGQTPSASGLRHFYHTIGPAVFDDLCSRFVRLLRQYGLFPEHSTYPDDPPGRGISLTQDGMLHQARSRPSCQLAEDTCYQPLAQPDPKPEPLPDPIALTPPIAPMLAGPTDPGQTSRLTPNGNLSEPPLLPSLAPARPCRALAKSLPGCACDNAVCQQQCQRASRLDPEARFIHYEGRNTSPQPRGRQSRPSKRAHQSGHPDTAKADQNPGKSDQSKGVDLFGYRSVSDRGLDDRWAVAWNLQTGLYSANTDERTIFVRRLAGLQAKYPDLAIGEWLDDSGVGYDEPLMAIYELGALRMVDIRAHATDEDPEACLKRGYDGQGRPLCPHGYPLRSNGYDYERRERKYVCAQVCRRQPLHDKAVVAPVECCPYLGEPGALGYVVNVGKTLPDGSWRLARDIPYGSPTWKARYGRRNLSESRNGQLQGMGVKRMLAYGLDHDTRDVQTSDFLLNLHSLGRLVREATELGAT